MNILGVDPGLSGALAMWDGRNLEVVDVPIMKARSRGNEVNIPALVKIIDGLGWKVPVHAAYIERNSARPKEGVSSSRKAGLVEGILLGSISVHCDKVFRPTPQQWKKTMGLNKDKDYSRTKAIETFPQYHELFARKKDHGRAEAALLAYYGFREQAKTRRKRLR